MSGPLIVCPSCSLHVRAPESACPHCGSKIYSGGKVLGRTAGAVLMGLALAGCPADDEPDDDMASSGTPTTAGSSTSEGSTSDPTDVTTSALYGGPATGEITTSSSDGSSSSGGDTDGSSSGTAGDTGSTSLSPDYGVPTTTTGE